MNNITYIIHSHSSYEDILEIQSNNYADIPNKILLIDKPVKGTIMKLYDRIVYYPKDANYLERVSSIKDVNTKYILTTCDTDILLSYDKNAIDNIMGVMDQNELDCVGLMWHDWNTAGKQQIDYNDSFSCLDFRICKVLGNNFSLNPKVWNAESYFKICRNNTHINYRQTDLGKDLQSYVKNNFKIYRCSSNKYFDAGYLRCNYFYKFFHITRRGGMAPISDERLCAEFQKFYASLIEKYNLRKTNRSWNLSYGPSWSNLQ